jgi:hypothetical protein
MKRRLLYLALAIPILVMASCDDDSKPHSPDVTPPDRTTLCLLGTEHDSIRLGWVAPGDDGVEGRASAYEIRCSIASLTEANWDSARSIPDLAIPRMPGAAETTVVTGLRGGLWNLALRTGDEVPNWSEISNVVSATVADTVPPTRVADLEATAVTASSVTLEWTAPFDASELRRAVLYQMRYALDEITNESWDDAVAVEGLPEPGPARSWEAMTVTGLDTGTVLHFALRSVDWASNVSSLSNVVSAGTQRLQQLTSDAHSLGGAHCPDWSPDGTHIVYATDWDPTSFYDQIYIIPAQGGTRIRITEGEGGGTQPSWSPDGTKIVFVSYREVDPATWQALSVVEPRAGAEPEIIASHGNQRVRYPTWSPTGDRIAYVVQETEVGEPPIYSMFTMQYPGGEPSRIYRATAYLGGLSWSPDGSQIAFHVQDPSDYEFDLWMIPADGGIATRLTSSPGNESKPDWSPDGTRIAYSSDHTGIREIWTMNESGGDRRQVTSRASSGHDAGDPAWSPNQRAIAFILSDHGLYYDIWIIYLD